MTEFNQRVREAREATGQTISEVWADLRGDLAGVKFSTSTLQRLETDIAEQKANPVILFVLSRHYGVELADLSPVAAARIERLLVRSEQGERNLPWNFRSAGERLRPKRAAAPAFALAAI